MAQQYSILKQIPNRISDIEVQQIMSNNEINWSYMAKFKEYAALQDEILANWLNISVRTFRNYKKPDYKFKDNIKEQVILLLSLFKHGVEIFGSNADFYAWLNTGNFFFDDKAPVSFLKTITGIRYVDERLTAMEYGDNI